jgi:hypothetical protein
MTTSKAGGEGFARVETDRKMICCLVVGGVPLDGHDMSRLDGLVKQMNELNAAFTAKTRGLVEALRDLVKNYEVQGFTKSFSYINAKKELEAFK